MSRKLQNTLLASLVAVSASFTVTSIMFNSFDWFRNHRAIALTSAIVYGAVFTGYRYHQDKQPVPQLLIKEAMANELLLKLSDDALNQEERDALLVSTAVFKRDCDRIREQSIDQLTTLNQLL